MYRFTIEYGVNVTAWQVHISKENTGRVLSKRGYENKNCPLLELLQCLQLYLFAYSTKVPFALFSESFKHFSSTLPSHSQLQGTKTNVVVYHALQLAPELVLNWRTTAIQTFPELGTSFLRNRNRFHSPDLRRRWCCTERKTGKHKGGALNNRRTEGSKLFSCRQLR